VRRGGCEFGEVLSSLLSLPLGMSCIICRSQIGTGAKLSVLLSIYLIDKVHESA